MALSLTLYDCILDETINIDENRSFLCFVMSLVLLLVVPLLQSNENRSEPFGFALHFIGIFMSFLWVNALLIDLWWTSTRFGSCKHDLTRFNVQCLFVFSTLAVMIFILVAAPKTFAFMLLFIVITLLLLDVFILVKTGMILHQTTDCSPRYKNFCLGKQIDR